MSSIQELLALKNRVLMALQKHGIGKPGQTGGNAQPAAAPTTPGNQGAATPAAGAAPGTSTGEAQRSPSGIGIVAALVAVVLLLLVRVTMRRRKPGAQPPADAGGHPSPEPIDGSDAAAPRAADASDGTQSHAADVSAAAATAAGVAASSGVEQQQGEVRDHPTDAAGFEAATTLGADALPPTLFESPHGAPRPADDVDEAPQTHDEPQPRGVEPGEPETLADAAGAASLEAAAALGAEALPPESVEAARVHAEEAERAQRADDARYERAVDAGTPQAEAGQHQPVEQAEPHEPQQPAAADDFPPQAVHEATSNPESAATTEPPVAPTEFPADAVAALDTLDMPLPPRVGEPSGVTPPPTGPVASADTIGRQSGPFDEPPAPPAGGTIEAGTAGAGSIAGLGAARFGALSLDFDLNLPPNSAEPLPVFTPAQLAQIARNKLDLAHEYIALGDLAGARTLINEVIESNDLATRADAQALLATLAPLS